jgi:hypothetical protein
MIVKFIRSYIRRYRDNEQTIAYVEWIDHKGKEGRTEGPPTNTHMLALMNASDRQKAPFKYEVW